MKKLIVIILCLLVIGCSKAPIEEKKTGMPNPASEFCVDKGYELEIRTNPDGSQTGYCIFPDESECEEWTYYRGECPE